MKCIIGFSIFLFLGLSTKGQTEMINTTELKGIVCDSLTAIQWIRQTLNRIPVEDTISKLQNGHPFILDRIEWSLSRDSIKKYLLFGVGINDAYAYISEDNKFSLFFVAELNNFLFEKIYASIGYPDKEMGEKSEDGKREFLKWHWTGDISVIISLNLMANRLTDQLRKGGNKMYSIVVSNIEENEAVKSSAPRVEQ